jgi:hypothetical protein
MENYIKKLLIICLLSIFNNPFQGQNIFFKSYGGNGNDYGENIISTRDSGFLAIGATESYGNGLTDMYFVKTDKDGNVLWHKAYGGANIDYGKSVVETLDSGFIACGYSNSENLNYDIFLVKINKNGILQWSKSIGGNDWDFGNRIIKSVIDSNHFYIVGKTFSYGSINGDGFVLKINSFGDSLWMKTYGGNMEDEFEDIIQSENGNLYCIGNNKSVKPEPRLWISCQSKNGDTLWNYYSDSTFSTGKSITKIEEKIIFCGSVKRLKINNTTANLYYLIGGIDTLGNDLFHANYNYFSKIEESCVKVIKKSNSNNYHLISNLFALTNKIFHAELLDQWVQGGAYNINGNEDDIVNGADTIMYSNGFVAIGTTQETNNGFTDIFISKTENGIWDSNYSNNLLLSKKKLISSKLSVFPNPADDFIEINNVKIGSEINIYNLRGELVDHFIYNNSKYNSKHLKAGFYLMQNQDGINNLFIKIIKL